MIAVHRVVIYGREELIVTATGEESVELEKFLASMESRGAEVINPNKARKPQVYDGVRDTQA